MIRSASIQKLLFLFPLLAWGCGGREAPVDRQPDSLTCSDTVLVTVNDTIGVLMGDSLREFGNITEVCVSSADEIYVLDGLKCRLSVFSPSGSAVAVAGRYGNGPGEYLYPRSMALYPDGRMIVSDWPGARITYLNSDFSVDTVISGFGQFCPHSIDPLTGFDYIGGDLEFRTTEDGLQGDLVTAVYGRQKEPLSVFWRDPLTIVTENIDGQQSVNVYNADIVRDTSDQGITYLAVRSDTTWAVAGLDTSGDTLLFIHKEWEPVPRSEEELARGDYTESLSFNGDGPSSISRGRTTEGMSLFRTAISSIDTDSEGNIWVGQAWTDWPVFEIYSPAGELLRIAQIPDFRGTEGIQYAFGESLMIAYDTQPEDYPKVYLLEVSVPSP